MAETNEQLFVRVVEAGSLKAAAEQIGSDPSAVSRRIAALEARLGVKLLQRSTRRSSPTEAGQRFYDGLRRILEEQAALEADVAGLVDRPTGRLGVAAPVDFGARFVAPVLATLQDEAPGLTIDLRLGSAFADLVEQGLDVAIRIGRLPDSSLIARRLGFVPRVLVGSPSYLRRSDRIVTATDLQRHDFILYRPGDRRSDITLERDGVSETVTVYGHFTANSVTAIRALVVAGRGLHLGPVWAFEDELRAGDVVPVLPDWSLPAYPVHALYAPTAYVPAKIRRFIDLTAEAFRASGSLQ